MTRAELNAIFDQLCIEDDDNVVFAEDRKDHFHFYEPVAYSSGFVVIQAIHDDEAKKGKKP